MIKYRPPPLLSLMMISSPSHLLNPVAHSRFIFVSKPGSQIPCSFHHRLPVFPKISLFYSLRSLQNMTFPKCCSASGYAPADPIPSSGTAELNDPNPQSYLVVVSFYKFADFPDYADMRKPLKHLCEELVLRSHYIF